MFVLGWAIQQALHDNGREFARDFLDGPSAGLIPFHCPVERAQDEQTRQCQVCIGAKFAALLRFQEDVLPNRRICVAQPEVLGSDRLGHLAENAACRERVVANLDDGREMGPDRGLDASAPVASSGRAAIAAFTVSMTALMPMSSTAPIRSSFDL